MVKVDPRGASLYEKGRFRRVKRGRSVRSLTQEGWVLWEPGVWEGEEKAGRRVREKIEAEDKVC